MPATDDEVTFTVETVASAESVYRAALETDNRAFQVHRTHLFAVALSVAAAASGSILLPPVLAMWLVLRILTPDDDLLCIAPYESRYMYRLFDRKVTTAASKGYGSELECVWDL